MGLGAAVTRAVGNGRAEGHGAVGQRGNHAGRNAHAPVAAGVNGGGVLVRTEGDNHFIPDVRAGCRPADDLRLAVLHAVNHVIARHHVKADGRRRGVKRNRLTRAARVPRGVAHAHLHGVAAIRQCGQIAARNVHAPDAALLHLGGKALTAQRHGDRLPGFRRGGAGDSNARSRFAAVNHVIACDRINGHGWRSRVHAVFAARRGAVAVRVGDAHLHAGVTVLKARKVCRRHGGGPVTVSIHLRCIRLAAEDNGNGLVFLHVRGAAGEHQIRALLRRVNHVVGGNRIDADSHRRQIDGHVMADGHRVARRALACNGHGDRTCCEGRDVCRRDRRAPGAVCQHGGRIGFAIDGHGERCACRQPVAGARDDQVLSMFDAVNHIVARYRINAQARQVSVDRDLALAGPGVAMAVGDGC